MKLDVRFALLAAIAACSPAGTRPERPRAELLNRVTNAYPAWSPDGRTIAYARYQWFPDQPFYEASDIYVVRTPEP